MCPARVHRAVRLRGVFGGGGGSFGRGDGAVCEEEDRAPGEGWHGGGAARGGVGGAAGVYRGGGRRRRRK